MQHVKIAILRRRNQAGSTLVPVVSVSIILMIASLTALELGRYYRLQGIHNEDRILAEVAADAGLTKALGEMNQLLAKKALSGTLPADSDTLPDTQATYSYKVVKVAGAGYEMASTGTSDNETAGVKATLRLAGLFDYALYAEGPIVLMNSSVVDGINFTADTPALKVATESTSFNSVVLKSDSEVDGDVLVGPGGDPGFAVTIGSGVNVTGGYYAMGADWDPPVITVPDYLISAPSGGTITTDTVLTTSGRYDTINLGNAKVLSIQGNVELYVTGDITLGNNATIEISDSDPDNSLTLYLGGDYEEKNGASMNNLLKDSLALRFYALPTCQNVIFKNGGQFYGSVYAPTADVVVNNSMEVFGSLITKTFDQKNSGNIHYDANLANVDEDDIGVRFVIHRWEKD